MVQNPEFGNSLFEAEKKMVKKERLRNIIEHNIEKKKQQLCKSDLEEQISSRLKCNLIIARKMKTSQKDISYIISKFPNLAPIHSNKRKSKPKKLFIEEKKNSKEYLGRLKRFSGL
jgi:hypothetical protein